MNWTVYYPACSWFTLLTELSWLLPLTTYCSSIRTHGSVILRDPFLSFSSSLLSLPLLCVVATLILYHLCLSPGSFKYFAVNECGFSSSVFLNPLRTFAKAITYDRTQQCSVKFSSITFWRTAFSCCLLTCRCTKQCYRHSTGAYCTSNNGAVFSA